MLVLQKWQVHTPSKERLSCLLYHRNGMVYTFIPLLSHPFYVYKRRRKNLQNKMQPFDKKKKKKKNWAKNPFDKPLVL